MSLGKKKRESGMHLHENYWREDKTAGGGARRRRRRRPPTASRLKASQTKSFAYKLLKEASQKFCLQVIKRGSRKPDVADKVRTAFISLHRLRNRLLLDVNEIGGRELNIQFHLFRIIHDTHTAHGMKANEKEDIGECAQSYTQRGPDILFAEGAGPSPRTAFNHSPN
ncbi:hypothetical protein EVAR_50827_1 [Eumeta japonica]|uniref:Uncharacterized protein n=1 Tax=Eumeta variegata TaxID=151549 RepID=A0A4C1XGL3_EUMVA|nr:hypothetical protein EVAR_50827_1 [Eumeta japonica]